MTRLHSDPGFCLQFKFQSTSYFQSDSIFPKYLRPKHCENTSRELISDHPPASIHLGKLSAVIPEATQTSVHLASVVNTQSRENLSEQKFQTPLCLSLEMCLLLMMMMMLLYGSSLCLKTVSSLLNLALKAMKLESPAPKQSLINLSQPQGVRASDQIPLFKFRKEIFWTPGQIEYPVGSHLCESNFGLKPKSRIHLSNDHQLENPWPLPLKGLGLEMIGR